jgi:hypothetical protein
VPNKQLLAQMRYRPWSGVFLNDEYLSSVEDAETITKDLLKLYHQANIVPLLETRLSTLPELQHALQLLERGAELSQNSLCDEVQANGIVQTNGTGSTANAIDTTGKDSARRSKKRPKTVTRSGN